MTERETRLRDLGTEGFQRFGAIGQHDYRKRRPRLGCWFCFLHPRADGISLSEWYPGVI